MKTVARSFSILTEWMPVAGPFERVCHHELREEIHCHEDCIDPPPSWRHGEVIHGDHLEGAEAYDRL